MGESDRIGSVVKLRKFAPVVDLQWADSFREDSSLNLIEDYIVTGELAAHFEKVLEGFTLKRHERKALREGNILDASIHSRAHILRGQYGTGKSYFLLMLCALLESLGDPGLYEELTGKFRMFDGIRFHMDHLKQSNSKYMVVRIDGVKNVDMRFHELVQKSVISRIEKVLGECDFYDSYGIALRKLEEYRHDPVFSKLLSDALESRSLSYGGLADGLKASRRKSLKEYKEIIEAVTRHKIDEGFDSLEAFLRAASVYVKNKGYAGIVILFDEFSAYVNASIEDRRITADLASIQSLAQLAVPREGQDLFFICSMHVDIGRILSNVMTAAEEIQKVRGRFSEMTLSFSNSGNIVENILSVDRAGFAALQAKYQKYFGALPSRYPDMAKVYPVHPHTVASIIKVSVKFAQNERTIFSFFAETVNKKIGEPVVKDERLNLITTREIYDYFIDTISERNIALKDSALRCMAFCRNELERDVVKALVIACVSAGENADSRLSPKDIAFIIGVDDIRQIDLFLKETSMNPVSNIIFYEKEYRFEFIAAGNATGDISNRLDEEAADLNSYDALLDVLEEYSASICIRKAYTISPSKDALPVRKDLTGVIFRPADLLKSLDREMSDIEKDGRLLFVIPGFNDEIGKGFIQNISKSLLEAPSNLCVAVPKTFPLQLEKDLKYFAAAKNMTLRRELDEPSRKTLLKIFQAYQKVVEHEIKKFGSTGNFTFIFNGNTVKEGFSSLEELERFLILRHYCKFPRVDCESIRGKNSIHSLVDDFIVFGEKTNIPANYSSEPDRLIMDMLRPLDLVKVERSGSGYSARLKIPEESNNRESYEIWTIVNNTGKPLKDLFTLLEGAPYGLPDYMTELYIAAAVAANQLTIKYRGQAVLLNKMSVALLNTKEYTLEKVVNASPELKAALKRVWMVFCKIHSRCGARNYLPEMPQNDADTCSAVSGDMTDITILLEGFRARLENVGIRNGTLIGLIKAVNELILISNPVDYMEAFVRLPQKVSHLEEVEPAIEVFVALFDFMAQINSYLDELRDADMDLNEMRCLEGVHDEFEELKRLYGEITEGFDRLKKEIGDNRFSADDVKKLKNKLSILISGYNESFSLTHENVNKATNNLFRLFDTNAVRLIESFEKINFRNIKSLADIHVDLRGIKACANKPVRKENEPLTCSCTGYPAGLAGLLERLHQVEKKAESVAKQISNIGSNYVSRLIDMDESGNGVTTFGAYLQNVAGAASDKAIQDFVSFKSYLDWGFDVISEKYCEEVTELVAGLSSHINRYLAGDGMEKKQEKTASPAKRKIAFRSLYEQIQLEIANSGYKSVTVEEFSRALKEIIDKVKKEYDEVEID